MSEGKIRSKTNYLNENQLLVELYFENESFWAKTKLTGYINKLTQKSDANTL